MLKDVICTPNLNAQPNRTPRTSNAMSRSGILGVKTVKRAFNSNLINKPDRSGHGI